MKKPKYIINQKPFNSQDEIKKHFQKILRSSNLDSPLQGESLRDCLSLFERHPEHGEKVGCGVKSVVVTLNPVFGDRCFWIIRKDGSTVDISYLACIKAKAMSARSHLMAACRNAVAEQVLDYKAFKFGNSEVSRCNITKRIVSKNDADIDHVIPFCDIVDSFVRDRSVDVSSVQFTENEFGVSVDFADKELKKQWQHYHQIKAVLQLTHREANQSKGRRPQNENP